MQHLDLSQPTELGVSFALARKYNSSVQSEVSVLGSGWNHSYDQRLSIHEESPAVCFGDPVPENRCAVVHTRGTGGTISFTPGPGSKTTVPCGPGAFCSNLTRIFEPPPGNLRHPHPDPSNPHRIRGQSDPARRDLAAGEPRGRLHGLRPRSCGDGDPRLHGSGSPADLDPGPLAQWCDPSAAGVDHRRCRPERRLHLRLQWPPDPRPPRRLRSRIDLHLRCPRPPRDRHRQPRGDGALRLRKAQPRRYPRSRLRPRALPLPGLRRPLFLGSGGAPAPTPT